MRLTSAGALLVLLLLAGCGGSDNSFTEGYNKAVEPLSQLGQGMGDRPREFDVLARRTGQTRRKLAKLDPPEDAQDEFDALLGHLGDVTADLRAVATAARGNDVVKQREAATRLVRSTGEVQQAETALKAAVEG